LTQRIFAESAPFAGPNPNPNPNPKQWAWPEGGVA